MTPHQLESPKLVSRFEDQLPCRTGPQTHHSRCNVQQNKDCLIQISKFKFSLVISGLTKILQRINELRPTHAEFERDYYESLLIVLDTLEKCLSSQVFVSKTTNHLQQSWTR